MPPLPTALEQPMKVRKVINLLDDEFRLVTLHPGDEVPAWAESRITNPDVLELEQSEAPVTPDVPDVGTEDSSVSVDYSKMSKKQLVPLLEARGLSTSGKVAELRERLADAEASADDDEEVDVFDMPRDQLEQIAKSNGIEFDAETSDEELAVLIDDLKE